MLQFKPNALGRRSFLAVPAALLSTHAFALSASENQSSHFTVGSLLTQLHASIDAFSHAPAIVREWELLRRAHGVSEQEMPLQDFARVRTLFEATRSGGLWRLRWDITNQKPNSEQIWKQWKGLSTQQARSPEASATAECDELSALFAFLAYRSGIRGVGLFWPVWNHVVAVWVLRRKEPREKQVRIVIPTSQIMLPASSGIGDRHFDAYTQKTIFEYRRRDIALTSRLPAALAQRFLNSVAQRGELAKEEFVSLRLQRLGHIHGVDSGYR